MFYWNPFYLATLAKLQNEKNFDSLKASTYFFHLQVPEYVCANLQVFQFKYEREKYHFDLEFSGCGNPGRPGK